MEKVLVTGATGSLGRIVTDVLAKNSIIVKAGARNPEKSANLGWSGVQVVELDFEDPNTFKSALDDTKTIVLIAPSGNPDNDKLIIPFLNRAKKMGIKKIVNISAMGIEYNDEAPLRKVEKHILELEFDYIFIRPNWFFQNFNTSMLEPLRSQKIISLPADDAKVSYIDVRDIADVVFLACRDNDLNSNEITLTGATAISHFDIAKAIEIQLHQSVTYTPVTDDEFRTRLTYLNVPNYKISFMLMLFGMMKKGFAANVSNDFFEITGKQPRTVDDYAKDFKNNWIV